MTKKKLTNANSGEETLFQSVLDRNNEYKVIIIVR